MKLFLIFLQTSGGKGVGKNIYFLKNPLIFKGFLKLKPININETRKTPIWVKKLRTKTPESK